MESEHLAAQFKFNSAGHVETVTQETPECTAARVYHVAVCPIGFREDNPEFGVPEVAFQQVPLSTVGFESAILQWEPEATLEIIEEVEQQVQGQRILGVEVS